MILLIIFSIVFLITLALMIILYEIKRTDVKLKVIHVYKGKMICEEEAKMYELDYIEYYNGMIIKYYVKLKGIK